MSCIEKYYDAQGELRERPCEGQPSGVGPLARRDAPSFLAKVKNFAVSSAKHVASGMPMATDAEILRRHDICRGCEFLQENACLKCGCPVVRQKKFISKLSWANESCPIGKWGPADTNT